MLKVFENGMCVQLCILIIARSDCVYYIVTAVTKFISFKINDKIKVPGNIAILDMKFSYIGDQIQKIFTVILRFRFRYSNKSLLF